MHGRKSASSTSALRAVLRAAATRRSQARTINLEPSALTLLIDCVREAVSQTGYSLPSHAAQWALADASQQMAHLLPDDVCEQLNGIYRADSHPCVLVRGLPLPPQDTCIMDPLLHTLSSVAASGMLATLAVHAAVCSHVGQQYTFVEERGDNAFHLVLPAAHIPADSQSSVGASAVNFHTEDPVPPVDVYQPRALGLLMLRAQPGVYTAVCTVDDLADDLLAAPSALIDVLAAPRFTHPAPDVVRLMGGDGAGAAEEAYVREGRPVLYLHRVDHADGGTGLDTGGDSRLVVSIMLVEATDALHADDAEAREAIRTLRRLLDERATRYSLQPGELLVWANQRAAHGRTGALRPRYDGVSDRLLLRTFHHPKRPAMVVRDIAHAAVGRCRDT